MEKLFLFSGACLMAELGNATGVTDEAGNELHTGDLVMLFRGHYIGQDYEGWYPQGLTMIVEDKYETYLGNEYTHCIDKSKSGKPFTMGIADHGVQSDEWKVQLVTSHKDMFHGFSIIPYGFNVKSMDANLISIQEDL